MTLFNPHSETLIHNWDQTIEKQIRMQLILTGHPEDTQFINFADQMKKTTSNLMIESKKNETGLPGFVFKENVTYSALPLEKELEPFLEALSHINARQPLLSEPIRETLDKIDIPVRLKLYIALQCPFCPNVVRTVIPLAFHCKFIHLHIIDGSLFPETAQKDKVMSAPCLMLDDDFRWTGSVAAEEITKMILNRDPSLLSQDTLRTILEQGDASWIARQMMDKKKIFDSFVKLLIHETWSVRLGAMVVVEELCETDPELAALLGPILIKKFHEFDVPIQGDILYALGEIGTMETKEWIIAKLPQLEHQDLIDAATEAIDTLTS